LQVPTLAYESKNEPQLQTVYESLICNEFLEVRITMPTPAVTKPRASFRAPDLTFQLLPVLIRPANGYHGLLEA